MSKFVPLVTNRFLFLIVLVSLFGLGSRASAQPPKDGWASETGFRNTNTPIDANDKGTDTRSAIVKNAWLMKNRPSGSSFTGGIWLTDTADGDGTRMRKAI